MKYVQVKNDIQIMLNGEIAKEPNGIVSPPWSLGRYLDTIVLADPAMGIGYKVLNACRLMEEQFKAAKPGDWVAVEDEHWEMLKRTIENPQGGGIHPNVLRQFLPFMDVILEAKSISPAELGKENAA